MSNNIEDFDTRFDKFVDYCLKSGQIDLNMT